MTYRPDIDGLRAVSVIAVVLYHAQFAFFSGGFVGVDVFFVISGFLITGIIARELEAGRFSLWRFYERRIRRIAPPLLAMALFVAVFTLLFKTPDESRTFGESISFFGILASNHFFLQERGYFDVPREAFALLHTWSLAVEEQFYLVFPFVLMGLAAASQSRRIAALGALAALSFIGAAWVVATAAFDDTATADVAFFFAPFRAWELLLGGLLAVGAPSAAALSSRSREALGWLGLALIAVPVIVYEESLLFPGPTAVPPCLGAAILIWLGMGGAAPTRVGRALAWPPAVYVGLISYSLYLWHWPFLSFAEYYAMRPLSLVETWAVIAASVVAAAASHRYIERPFRRPDGVLARRPLFIATAACLLLCVGLGAALQETRGLPQRFSPETLALSTGDSREFGVELADCADERGRLSPAAAAPIVVMFCRVGAQDQQPKILLWGDSHALSISPAFETAAKSLGVSVVVTSRAACTPAVGYAWEGLQTRDGCVAHNDAVLQAVAELGVEQVFLFAAWGAYANGADDAPSPRNAAALEARLAETVAAIQAAGASVVIGASAPVYGENHIPSVLHRAAVFGREAPIDRSRAAHEAFQAPEKQILERVAERDGAALFPLDAHFCDQETCAIARDGLPLYADHGHINVRAARALGPEIAALIQRRGAEPTETNR